MCVNIVHDGYFSTVKWYYTSYLHNNDYNNYHISYFVFFEKQRLEKSNTLKQNAKE